MKHVCLGLLAGVALILPWQAAANEPQADPKAQALAARIDKLLAAAWAVAKVEPAPPADDAEFLRRIYLDLAGRIPSVSEVRAFLKDPRPDKRQRVIEKLLGSPRYVTHFGNYWRSLMLPEASANFQVRFTVPQFQAWLESQLRENVGYDKLARALLTVAINRNDGVRVGGGRAGGQDPMGFYVAKEFKPENLAASLSRLFLGVRVECAQCHNHPFADWKREQFWGMAAFFAGIERRQQGDFTTPTGENADKREITIAGTERVVPATFLDGKQPKFESGVSPRATLADWMASPDNPFFARAAVNRMWAHLLGTGIIEPVDEMVGGESTPSHPELLDELARAFAASNFDLKFLIRAITYSKAYQLTSRADDKGTDEARLFTRMPLRGLTPEQLWDSLAEATGFHDPQGSDPNVVFRGGNSPRQEFLTKFANQTERAVEAQTSILQALALMNGRVIAEETSIDRSNLLAGILDAPFFNTESRIETLYLATLTRPPTAKERERVLKYLDEAPDKKAALADVFWALLNSSEFILNH